MVNISEFDEILEKISDTNFKGSAHWFTDRLKKWTKRQKFYKFILQRGPYDYLNGWLFTEKLYLTEVVNQKIGIFYAAGLIEI